MGAKKNKHLSILAYKENKAKDKAHAMQILGFPQEKIDIIKAKETKYKNWKKDVQDGPDY
jgi:hypothetical protein